MTVKKREIRPFTNLYFLFLHDSFEHAYKQLFEGPEIVTDSNWLSYLSAIISCTIMHLQQCIIFPEV